MEPTPKNTLKLSTHTPTPKPDMDLARKNTNNHNHEKSKPNLVGATEGASLGEQKLLQRTIGCSQYSLPVESLAHLDLHPQTHMHFNVSIFPK